MLLPVTVVGAVLRPDVAVGQRVPVAPDSAQAHRTVNLPPARVEAAELPHPSARTPPPGAYETTFDAATLRSLGPGASLGAVLAQRSPLAVRQYGPGQLASLSVRGMAAQHVAVLWQGFNINFPTLGQADLALLPAAALTSAVLHHGPDAARVGSGAVGGALELNTDADVTQEGYFGGNERGFQAEAAVSNGSFGQWAASARVSGQVSGKVSGGQAARRRQAFSTSVQGAQATNDFSYRYRTFRGEQTARQVNAATRSYSVTHDHSLDLSPDWRLTAAVWLTAADRQLAPPLNTANTHAQEQDASQRVALSVRYRSRTTVRVATLTDVIDYRDDLTGPSDSRSQSWQTQVEHTQPLGDRLTGRVGVEGQHFRARADGFGPELKTENRAALFAELSSRSLLPVQATLTIRQAMVQNRRVPLTPALGVDWRLPRLPLTLRASAARAYRAPTLNERFWRVGGNPALQAETSDSYSVGLRFRQELGNRGSEAAFMASPKPRPSCIVSAEVAAFDQRVADWVQWTPDAATGIWSPRNLRRVRSRGVEGQAEAQFLRRTNLTLRVAGQLLETRKTSGTPADPVPVGVQLPYVPMRTGSATVVYAPRLGRKLTLTTDLSGTLTSQRNTSDSGTETLPMYGLLNAGIGGEWAAMQSLKIRLRLDAFNLLNTEYQSQTNRPMPGRSWQVTLGLAYR